MNLEVFEEAKTKYPPGYTDNSSPYTISQAIYALIRLLQPSHVVEVGTFHGATSIWLARAVAENGRGRFTGFEADESNAEVTKTAIRHAVPDFPFAVKGNILNEPYVEADFIFLDCDKATYGPALSKCVVPINGYVVAHDTVAWPQAVQFYKWMTILNDFEVVNLHTESGLMIARKIA